MFRNNLLVPSWRVRQGSTLTGIYIRPCALHCYWTPGLSHTDPPQVSAWFLSPTVQAHWGFSDKPKRQEPPHRSTHLRTSLLKTRRLTNGHSQIGRVLPYFLAKSVLNPQPAGSYSMSSLEKYTWRLPLALRADSHISCRARAVRCGANSHIPCCAPAVPQQCRVLRESLRVAGKIRTANRKTPHGSRKKPNLSRSPTGCRETADVN